MPLYINVLHEGTSARNVPTRIESESFDIGLSMVLKHTTVKLQMYLMFPVFATYDTEETDLLFGCVFLFLRQLI